MENNQGRRSHLLSEFDGMANAFERVLDRKAKGFYLTAEEQIMINTMEHMVINVEMIVLKKNGHLPKTRDHRRIH